MILVVAKARFVRRGLAILTLMSALFGCTRERQADHALADDWTPRVTRPEFEPGRGPVVLIDAAHGNWHTADGRFGAFSRLLEADGYQVRSAGGEIAPELLNEAGIYVIANAVLGGEDSVWKLPTPPALATAEIELLVDWVERGGSLLLIADHMPFPGSVSKLADAFGIVFINGYAKKSFDQGGTLIFSRASGSLADHAISRGRNASEAVSSVKTYTGQAFHVVAAAEPLLFMPDDWVVLLPADAFKKFDEATPQISARGLIQGCVLRFGLGRVAAFGEAAMFTAQAERRNGEIIRVGMNDPEAVHNAQFVLNTLHWLSGRLE